MRHSLKARWGMDNPKTTENLFELIDSGKEENLEMALQLSVNLAPEWRWIHVMLQSRKRLPTGYRSWYEAYAKAVEFDHERILFPVMTDGKADHQTYTMTEIHQGVALELHWQLFRLDARELWNETKQLEYELSRTRCSPVMAGLNVPKSKALDFVFKIIKLLPR